MYLEAISQQLQQEPRLYLLEDCSFFVLHLLLSLILFYSINALPAGAATSTVDIYDVNSGQWSSTSTGAGSLSAARFDLAAASLGNKIIFAGGRYVFAPLGFFFVRRSF